MSKPKLTLNGKEVSFAPGQTILQVAQDNGVNIPTLCYLKDCTPTGACRMCLVEIEGARSLMASCTVPANDGMVVKTDTEKVHYARKLNLELLLASGDHDCLVCEANGDCKLQALAYEYGVENVRFEGRTTSYEVEDDNPLIVRDFAKCILCGRCVQACNEVQVNRGHRLRLPGRGQQNRHRRGPALPRERLRVLRPVRAGLPHRGTDREKGQGQRPLLAV